MKIQRNTIRHTNVRNLQLSIIRIIGVNYHSGARAFSVFLAIYICATRLRQFKILGKLKISSVFIPPPLRSIIAPEHLFIEPIERFDFYFYLSAIKRQTPPYCPCPNPFL